VALRSIHEALAPLELATTALPLSWVQVAFLIPLGDESQCFAAIFRAKTYTGDVNFDPLPQVFTLY
jgi:hypothetical protein